GPVHSGPVDLAHRWARSLSHEIFLKVEVAGVGLEPSLDRLIAHGQDPAPHAVLLSKLSGNCMQGSARAKSPGAIEIGGQIAVAQLKPGYVGEFCERRLRGKRVAADSPAAGLV